MSFRWVKSPFPKGTYYFSGNEAAAEGAIAAGCRFYAGYPITPSSELMERIAVRLKEIGFDAVFTPGATRDEIVHTVQGLVENKTI